MFDQTNQTDDTELLLDSADIDSETAHAEETQAGGEPSYTVKYNGKELDIPISALLILAQKGMNYDRVVSQRDQYKNAVVSKEMPSSDAEQGFIELFRKYPELAELPDEVYQAIADGEAPINAYRDYENGLFKKQAAELNSQLEALKNNERNSAKAMSSQRDGGPAQSADEFLSGLFE